MLPDNAGGDSAIVEQSVRLVLCGQDDIAALRRDY